MVDSRVARSMYIKYLRTCIEVVNTHAHPHTHAALIHMHIVVLKAIYHFGLNYAKLAPALHFVKR